MNAWSASSSTLTFHAPKLTRPACAKSRSSKSGLRQCPRRYVVCVRRYSKRVLFPEPLGPAIMRGGKASLVFDDPDAGGDRVRETLDFGQDFFSPIGVLLDHVVASLEGNRDPKLLLMPDS